MKAGGEETEMGHSRIIPKRARKIRLEPASSSLEGVKLGEAVELDMAGSPDFSGVVPLVLLNGAAGVFAVEFL